MKKIAAILLALLLCFSSSFCVLAGEGGDVPDIEEEKEQHGSYFDKEEEEEFIPPVQPEFTPEPEEPQNSVLSAKVKSAIFWVCFIAVMDIELCLCSAIIIPVLSSKLNLDDVYTLKSGSYWIVHVNLTEKNKYIRAAMIRK